jgi:hypothetical protein
VSQPSSVVLAAVHAALRTLVRQFADDDGGDLESLVDPIVCLVLPRALRLVRFRRLVTEMQEREERCHPRAKSNGGSWARNSRGSGRGKRPKRA